MWPNQYPRIWPRRVTCLLLWGKEKVRHKGASPLLQVQGLKHSTCEILKSNKSPSSFDLSIFTSTILCQHSCPFVSPSDRLWNPQHLPSSLPKQAAEPCCRSPHCTDWQLRDTLLLHAILPDNTLFHSTQMFPQISSTLLMLLPSFSVHPLPP